MKLFAFCIVLAATLRSAEHSQDATLPLRERIALLKYQLAQEIEQNKNPDEKPRYQNDVSASLEKYQYVDIENQPITPINENDERKKHGKFRLRQLITTTDEPWPPTTQKIKKKAAKRNQKKKEKPIVADDLITSSEEHIPKLVGINGLLNLPGKDGKSDALRHEKLLSGQGKKERAPTNIFYRRVFDGDMLNKHCSKQTIHCTDLITPILTGQKINITDKRILTYKDHEVTKLLHLLSLDTSEMTKEDIFTSLYQISNLQIRLFQWDIVSLKLLFNTIAKGIPGEKLRRHSWKTLKIGLKQLFAGWHLDFANTTNLLHQARIFRPPCIANNNIGSTLSSKTFRYTKKVKPKCSDVGNDDSESCELG